MKKMTKQERIVRQRKQMLAAFIVLVFVCVCFTVFSINSQASQSQEVYKYYKSYEIKPGDSLWSIANDNMSANYSDQDSYINEIKMINHMLDDDLRAGDFIVISYYSTEEL